AGKHEPFYDDLRAGRWEPDTFAVLRRYLDRETAYADIGGWIGVTPYYAARFAKRVVAVEPDPAAFAILQGIREANGGDGTLVNAAVAPGHGRAVLHAVKRWGSSMSTLLAGAARDTGEAVTVATVTLDEVLAMAGGPNLNKKIKIRALIKIDIEG